MSTCRSLVFFGVLLTASLLASAQTQKIGARAQSDLKKQLTRYARARNDEAKEKAAVAIFRHGRAGWEFLKSLPLKDKKKEAIVALGESASRRLGLDILRAPSRAKPARWSPSYFSYDEIILLKKGDIFAGFMILSGEDAAQGNMLITTWLQKGPGRKLNQPGGTVVEKKSVKGEKAAKPLRPNSGYDEWVFRFEIGSFPVELRFIGPAYFRLKPQAQYGYSMSGLSRPGRLSNADRRIHYLGVKVSKLNELKDKLKKYIYRITPGVEPLNIDEKDLDAFAQYEPVQVEVRHSRLESELIVLVQFAEGESVSFHDDLAVFMRNFINELHPVKAGNLLISKGSAPSWEGNMYWLKGKWVPAKGPLIKMLRTNFPENY